MGAHIIECTNKAEKASQALNKLMPNTKGAKYNRRKILAAVTNSILLYGAAVWSEVVNKDKYKKKLEKVQRSAALRVACAYRTISTPALQVIANETPIHLMVKERTSTYKKNKQEKIQIKEETMKQWQKEWEENNKGIHTKKMIPEIKKWSNRKWGLVNYYLTQVLSGHGNFGCYLNRMKIKESDKCVYCDAEDTVQHTLEACYRWNEIRQETEKEVGTNITLTNMVDLMLEKKKNWEAIDKLVNVILKTKDIEERKRKT